MLPWDWVTIALGWLRLLVRLWRDEEGWERMKLTSGEESVRVDRVSGGGGDSSWHRSSPNAIKWAHNGDLL